MNTSRTIARLLALTLATGTVGMGTAWAQSDTDQGASQSNGGSSQTAPTQGMPMRQGGMMPGMGKGMGGSGMGAGQGMGGGQGMMGGGMPAMMHMMHERMARGDMGGPMGMMRFDHIEGRIAFLHAELDITDAQQTVWNTFADALRKQAGAMRGQMRQGGMPQNWPDMMARQEHMLSARLDAIKAIEEPVRALYAALSPDQQKKADALMCRPMGWM
ncbi:MAG TPA: Spy/CpxP family protein refolding chaperone [Rhodopila sp.]|nr:Spy/CpxP family protein refolding chaperone [Rhodopila sp.]